MSSTSPFVNCGHHSTQARPLNQLSSTQKKVDHREVRTTETPHPDSPFIFLILPDLHTFLLCGLHVLFAFIIMKLHFATYITLGFSFYICWIKGRQGLLQIGLGLNYYK